MTSPEAPKQPDVRQDTAPLKNRRGPGRPKGSRTRSRVPKQEQKQPGINLNEILGNMIGFDDGVDGWGGDGF